MTLNRERLDQLAKLRVGKGVLDAMSINPYEASQATRFEPLSYERPRPATGVLLLGLAAAAPCMPVCQCLWLSMQLEYARSAGTAFNSVAFAGIFALTIIVGIPLGYVAAFGLALPIAMICRQYGWVRMMPFLVASCIGSVFTGVDCYIALSTRAFWFSYFPGLAFGIAFSWFIFWWIVGRN